MSSIAGFEPQAQGSLCGGRRVVSSEEGEIRSATRRRQTVTIDLLKGVIDTPRRKRSVVKGVLRDGGVSPHSAAASPPQRRQKVNSRA